jgi:hypothetical protein
MSAEQTYYFKVFPRLPVMIVRFDGDGELPPGASFVYPDNAPALLPIEDVIVMSECLVDRLQGPGKPRGAHGLTPKGEQQVREIPGVSGVHLMLFGVKHEVLPQVVDGLREVDVQQQEKIANA